MNLLKFPTLGGMAGQMLDHLHSGAPVELRFGGLLAPLASPPGATYDLPRSGMAEWLMTDRELRDLRAVPASTFAGNDTVH